MNAPDRRSLLRSLSITLEEKEAVRLAKEAKKANQAIAASQSIFLAHYLKSHKLVIINEDKRFMIFIRFKIDYNEQKKYFEILFFPSSFFYFYLN